MPTEGGFSSRTRFSFELNKSLILKKNSNMKNVQLFPPSVIRITHCQRLLPGMDQKEMLKQSYQKQII